MSADPTHSIFQQTFSTTGEPDIYFSRLSRAHGYLEGRFEAKYVASEPKSLQSLWNLLRRNQQEVIPRMAMASKIPIYLITCIAGKEALVHRFMPDRCALAREGKIKPWECLVLVWELRRTIDGKWHKVMPDTPR